MGSDRNDEFIWKATLDGEFLVKSAYKIMFDKSLEPNDWGNVWFNHLILKINIFWWTTIHGKIITIDNLMKRGFQIPNRCYMCKREEESINHLFLHCSFSSKVWGRILQKLKVNWVFNEDMGHLVTCQGPFTHRLLINLWKIIPPMFFGVFGRSEITWCSKMRRGR